MKPTIEIVPDADQLTAVAAGLIRAAAAEAIVERGAFFIALAGGGTPRPIYRALADDPDVDWARWRLFWGDERCVPPDHPDSNYRMVKEALLDPLATRRAPLPALVARMVGELEPERAAAEYDQTLRELLPRVDGLPAFDLVLLGMGDDGHTASLFPGTAALHERERLAAANRVPQLDTTRLTLTFPAINAARRVLFLAGGAGKAAAFQSVHYGARDVERWPSQGVQPASGKLTWLVDAAAAAAHG